MFDCGEAGHAAEEIARGAFRDHAGGEVDEGLMDIVGRDGRGDAINEGGCHVSEHPRGKALLPSEVYTVRRARTGMVGEDELMR